MRLSPRELEPTPEAPRDVDAGSSRIARRELREALVVFFLVTLACALLWQLRGAIPLVGRFLHDLIASIFLLVPTILLTRQKEDFAEYGLVFQPVVRGLLFFAALSAAVFPTFWLGFVTYYGVVCRRERAGMATLSVYRRMCRSYGAGFRLARLQSGWRFAWLSLIQVGVVALPEEYFFRGYIQTKLERVWPPQRRWLGGGLGRALLITSLLFALGHVLVDLNPLRFAVFFPSLVFGWMRSATGSILAPVLFHATSNLVSDVLHRGYF
ncbi:MAG: CPBP family intramembrane metalloprotease [Deltaproteobacteria bacterium]|nr:CPBP family intramembrane metalloprotease [Deltaproteobacteria bacterium]